MFSNLFSCIRLGLFPAIKANYKYRSNLFLYLFSNYTTKSTNSDELPYEIREYLANNRIFKNVSIDDFKELIHTKEDEIKVNEILNTYELIKYESGYAPTVITVQEMQALLSLPNNNSIVKQIGRLFKKELLKLTSKAEKTIFKSDKAKEISEMIKNSLPFKMGINFDSTTGTPLYGKWRNTYFIGLSKTIYRTYANPLLCYSALLGQKIIFDCDYFKLMTKESIKLTHLQLCMSFGLNRKFPEPFDLWVMNFKIVSPLQLDFLKQFNESDQGIFINFREESYLDIFPHDKLKYLSPDAKNNLEEFDHDAIYIIGAHNDYGKSKPLSLIKSQKENIKSYRLPSEKYFSFKTTQVLNLYQTLKFLLNFKMTGSLYNSLKEAIPSSRYKSDQEIEKEQLLRINKLKHRKKKLRLLDDNN